MSEALVRLAGAGAVGGRCVVLAEGTNVVAM